MRTNRTDVKGDKDYVKKTDKDADSRRKTNKRYKKGSKRSSSDSRDTRRGTKIDVTTGEPFKGFANTKEGENDVAWYARNPQLLADNASFSFNAALGSKLDWSTNTSIDSTVQLNASTDERYAFPGIMAIHYANWCGTADESNSNTSAINIAAKNLYSFVRHTNSGHANYDETDLMMYIMAMDSLYSFIAYLRRVYGTARVFSQKNYYYQRMLTEAQGVDYDDLIANLSNFRGYINTIAAKASAFAVPKNLPIIMRHFWMASNVYKDHETEKAQLYLFQPEGFHIYKIDDTLPTPYNAAGNLIFKPFSPWNHGGTATFMTVSELVNYGDSLIEALLKSEDIGIISGDLLKAYQGNIFALPATPEEYAVIPIFNPEVLTQIQNSRKVPQLVRGRIRDDYPEYWHRLDILQNPNTNTIVADFKSAVGTPIFGQHYINDFAYTLSPVISLPFEHPTPADVMVATRLTQAWEMKIIGTADGTANEWSIEAAGTEIILEYYISEILSGSTRQTRTFQPIIVVEQDAAVGYNTVRNLLSASNFDWHPMCMMVVMKTDSSTEATLKPLGYMGDIDTYRMFTVGELAKLDQCALLSLYDVPVLGTY